MESEGLCSLASRESRGATLDSGVTGGRARLGVPLGDSGQINEARILLTIQEERTVGDETDMGVCAISNSGVCAGLECECSLCSRREQPMDGVCSVEGAGIRWGVCSSDVLANRALFKHAHLYKHIGYN